MSKKILVVDDELDALLMLETRLSDAGYEVIKADNGNEAVKKARVEQPDMVLLDIIMPGMDGVETAKVLASDSRTKDIPILFLSCLIRKGGEEGSKEDKRHYYMAKPYRPEKLLEIIERKLA